MPPEGFVTYYRLRNPGDGYYPGRAGLGWILTNPAYIGHWSFQGTVVRRDNHPAILPVKQFMQAFNYLSEYGFDGQKNPRYRPVQQHARPTLDSERPVERPLLAGLMFAYSRNQWRQVGTRYATKRQLYSYALVETEFEQNKPIWERTADWIDDAVARHIQEKLRTTYNSKIWQQNMGQLGLEFERERKLKRAQLSALEEAMQNMVTSIETMSNVTLIQAVETRFTGMQDEQKRLQSELEALENERHYYDEIQSLQGTFETAVAEWPTMSWEEKRALLHTFIERIEAVDPQRYGGIRLIVYWRNSGQDEIVLTKMPTIGDKWINEDIKLLLALVDEGASQFTIGEAFPNRKWNQIRRQIARWRCRIVFSPAYFRQNETFNEYVARGGKPSKNTGSRWSADEKLELGKLIEQGATQLEFMAAFPYRRWQYIREKVTSLFSSDCVITLDNGVLQKETYQDYQTRLHLLDTSSAACC